MQIQNIESNQISMHLNFYRPLSQQGSQAQDSGGAVIQNLVGRLEGRMHTDSRYGRLSDAVGTLQPLFQKLDRLTESIWNLGSEETSAKDIVAPELELHGQQETTKARSEQRLLSQNSVRPKQVLPTQAANAAIHNLASLTENAIYQPLPAAETNPKGPAGSSSQAQSPAPETTALVNPSSGLVTAEERPPILASPAAEKVLAVSSQDGPQVPEALAQAVGALDQFVQEVHQTRKTLVAIGEDEASIRKAQSFLKRELATLPVIQAQSGEPVLDKLASLQQLQQEPAVVAQQIVQFRQGLDSVSNQLVRDLQRLTGLRKVEKETRRQLVKQAGWQQDAEQASRILDQLTQAQKKISRQSRQLTEAGGQSALPLHALNITPFMASGKQVVKS